MTIGQIKTQIGQPVLTMVRQLDDAKNPTAWVSHWDNTNRVRVTMHEEVFNQIKADQNFGGLAVKKEVVEAKVLQLADKTTKTVEAYTRYVVITPKNIEATF